jgi:hypothetical protein
MVSEYSKPCESVIYRTCAFEAMMRLLRYDATPKKSSAVQPVGDSSVDLPASVILLFKETRAEIGEDESNCSSNDVGPTAQIRRSVWW